MMQRDSFWEVWEVQKAPDDLLEKLEEILRELRKVEKSPLPWGDPLRPLSVPDGWRAILSNGTSEG